MAAPDDLDLARRRFPVGAHVTGRVVHVPRPGAIGVFIDLGDAPPGFVDVLDLPTEKRCWPSIGTVASFEVLQHRRGQVRLFPLGDGIPMPQQPPFRPTEHDWPARKTRYPVGSLVTGTVINVYTSNREYLVRFDDCYAALEWTDTAPPIGSARVYQVTKHLDYTRRILLTPDGEPLDEQPPNP